MRTLLLALLCFVNLPAYSLDTGSTVPNIIGRTLDGDLFRLSKLDGIVVLNFFWVECAPCVKEIPELERLEQQFPQVTFVAVHVENEEHDVINRFIEKLDGHPKLIVRASPRVKDAYDVRVLPHTVIVHEQKLYSVLEGYTDKSIAKLTNGIRALLRVP